MTRSTVALGFALAACGTRGIDPGSGTSATSSTGAPATDTSGAMNSTTDNPANSSEATTLGDGSTSSGPASTCPLDDNFQCGSVPYPCEGVFPCGPAWSWFDENGCLREECDVTSCGEGFRCFRPVDECDGVCIGPRPTCSDELIEGEERQCLCGQDGSCGGSVCVPLEKFDGTECAMGR